MMPVEQQSDGLRMLESVTRQQVQETVDHLTAKGVSAVALHGDLEQRDRDQVLAMFANRSISVLVATDVAARGLDIDALDMVINVELARDSEMHIDRKSTR